MNETEREAIEAVRDVFLEARRGETRGWSVLRQTVETLELQNDVTGAIVIVVMMERRP